MGRLRIENRIEGKFRETCLDITGSSRPITRQNVTPVTLAVDQQILLSQLHQGISDGGITVRVKLHCVSDNVGHLIVAAIIQPFHGVQDTTLHRFQSILDMRDSPLQNHVGGIVQKPVLIHARQVVGHPTIFPRYFVVGVRGFIQFFRSILGLFCGGIVCYLILSRLIIF